MNPAKETLIEAFRGVKHFAYVSSVIRNNDSEVIGKKLRKLYGVVLFTTLLNNLAAYEKEQAKKLKEK